MKILLTLFITIIIFSSTFNTNNSISNDKNIDVISNKEMADIVSITSSGKENNYTFNVGISSPDTGCDQYANWWEVITEDGTLIYRRILGHSHVKEQPFIRSGGTIDITSDKVVIIRAHMNTSGYGTTAFKGSVNNGFKKTILVDNFAQDLATVAPLPNGCAF